MNLCVKKTASNVVKNDKNFTIRLSDLQISCSIVLYRFDGRIVKFLSFFTTFDAVFYAQIHDYNPFSFNITFAVYFLKIINISYN